MIVTPDHHAESHAGSLYHPPPAHGGDLAAARALFPYAPEPWLDLSTGINPRPYPVGDLPGPAWSRLPAAGDVDALCAAAAACFGVPDAASVVAAPGSQALIQWLPRLVRPGRVAVLAPTYGEHAAAWAAAGHRVQAVPSLARADGAADVVVVTNPNNPDGRLVASDALIDQARRLAGRGGWLVIDEAFADVVPTASAAAAAGQDGLVVLRSFGKFFGLAGVRLGFLLAPLGLAAAMRTALGQWAVSGPAIAIASRAFGDRRWIAATRDRLAGDSVRLDRLLARYGVDVVGGTPLFRLLRDARAATLFDGLGRHGIYVRRFPEHANWLRLGLPGDEDGWTRLDCALAAWAGGASATPKADCTGPAGG